MKINKIIIITLIACLITLIGCSKSEKATANEVKTEDESFLEDIVKSTEKRWQYVTDVETGEIEIFDEKEYLERCISLETELLNKYHEASFNDSKLKNIAMNYIAGLQNQQEAIKYLNVDLDKYDELWNEGYNKRTTALLTLVEDYGLELDEEQFEDLKTNAQIVKENKEIQTKIEEIVRNITFEETANDFDWTTYSTVVENTSGVEIEGFSLEIDLLDEESIVIGTESVYHPNNWKINQKIKLEFSTDTRFNQMKWTADYYLAN